MRDEAHSHQASPSLRGICSFARSVADIDSKADTGRSTIKNPIDFNSAGDSSGVFPPSTRFATNGVFGKRFAISRHFLY